MFSEHSTPENETETDPTLTTLRQENRRLRELVGEYQNDIRDLKQAQKDLAETRRERLKEATQAHEAAADAFAAVTVEGDRPLTKNEWDTVSISLTRYGRMFQDSKMFYQGTQTILQRFEDNERQRQHDVDTQLTRMRQDLADMRHLLQERLDGSMKVRSPTRQATTNWNQICEGIRQLTPGEVYVLGEPIEKIDRIRKDLARNLDRRLIFKRVKLRVVNGEIVASDVRDIKPKS